MHKIKVQNGTNATLLVKARVLDSVKKYSVETHYQVLPKTIVVLSAIHFFLEDLPLGMKLLWQTKDEPVVENKAAPPAPAPTPVVVAAEPVPQTKASPPPPAVEEQEPAAKASSGFSTAAGNRHGNKGARE